MSEQKSGKQKSGKEGKRKKKSGRGNQLDR